MVDEKRNLYQRIRAVALEVTSVDKTGKTQFGSKATSIGDVENALRGPMFEHGVITRWGYIELTDLSNGKLWSARLRVTVVNADDSSDSFEDEWADIGTNPMAATSFARKGYLKALFHLTGDEDEAHAPAPETNRRPQNRNVNTETGEIPFGPDPKTNSKKTEAVAGHVPNLDAFREEVRAAVVTVAQAENREAADIFHKAIKETGITTSGGMPKFNLDDLTKLRDWCAKQLNGVPA